MREPIKRQTLLKKSIWVLKNKNKSYINIIEQALSNFSA
jgi:hypothetical protein